MFNQVLSLCKNNYEQAKNYCCHNSVLMPCNCEQCLSEGFRNPNQPDDYNCYKKMNCYVLKYGSAYISEIYHYLNTSKILEPYKGQCINILSLGCGFCPDYFALSQYITDKGLGISLSYCGIDNSEHWNSTRLNFTNVKQSDLTNPFSFENSQIIMMNKVFSTIHKHKLHNVFLKNLENAIKNTMMKDTILIFNDVNSIYMGRDDFSKCIDPLFNKDQIRKFYTDNPENEACKGNGSWLHIQDSSIVCPITDISGIDILREVRQFVFFEYRK